MPTASAFCDLAQLLNHHREHGSDFAATDENDYVAQACAFLNEVLEAANPTEQRKRSNGEIVRFNRNTDQFAVMDANGVVQTYFKPMPKHLAPPGTPRRKMHRFQTNYDYFVDTSSR